MKTVTTRLLRQQMLIMAAAVYLLNAVFVFLLSGLEAYKTLYQGVDMTSAFTLGLVFSLCALFGTFHAHSRATLQLLTFAYMLPLTGTSMITMAVLYFTQQRMAGSLALWCMMALVAMVLALSFGMWWRASEQNNSAVVN